MNPSQPKLRWAENSPAEASPPCGPGPLLRDARLARRLDIGFAADQLKLRREVLEAMERDDYSSLPEPIYLRGYLAGYARLLGLPEREVLQQYASFKGAAEVPELTTQRPVRPQARSSDAKVRWFSYLVIFAMAAGIGWWSYERSSLDAPLSAFTEAEPDAGEVTPTPPPPLAVAPEAEAPADDVGVQPAPLQPAEDRLPPEATIAEPVGPPTSPAQPAPRAEQAELAPPGAADSAGAHNSLGAAPVPPPVAAPTVAAAGVDQLELFFRRDCWLEVRDASGERLAFGLAKAGSSRQLAGQAPFRVLVGDSGGVDVRLNGARVAPRVYEARDGRPARFSLGGPETAAGPG